MTLRIAIAGLLYSSLAIGCTAFCASDANQVLVGNNEDYNNPRTRIWFVPGKSGTFGRMYVGFDNMFPQGGMNERGLWFDGFATPPIQATSSSKLPRPDHNLADQALATCSTVEEVVQLFSRYNRAFLTNAILMFADASGDAASIEPDAIVRKKGRYFVQTNFHQSRPEEHGRCPRFKTATRMLEDAGDKISVDLFRRILGATHQQGEYPTLYSNVYELKSRTMHLYHLHDFNRSVILHLDEELKKGSRVLEIPSLFPTNKAAHAFPSLPGAVLGNAITVAMVWLGSALIALIVWRLMALPRVRGVSRILAIRQLHLQEDSSPVHPIQQEPVTR
jgi:hypothetical protein